MKNSIRITIYGTFDVWWYVMGSTINIYDHTAKMKYILCMTIGIIGACYMYTYIKL